MTIGSDVFQGEHFGLSIEHVSEGQADEWDGPGYEIYLPHQCDRWDIAYRSSPKNEAVERLEAFIKEAQSALEALKQDQGKDCEFTHAHTRNWCGNVRCRES